MALDRKGYWAMARRRMDPPKDDTAAGAVHRNRFPSSPGETSSKTIPDTYQNRAGLSM